MSEAQGDAWRWPLEGSCDQARIARIEHITSPYESSPPPICYPGTPLDREMIAMVPELMRKQLNGIGFHTPNGIGEGGFDSPPFTWSPACLGAHPKPWMATSAAAELRQIWKGCISAVNGFVASLIHKKRESPFSAPLLHTIPSFLRGPISWD